MKCIDTEIAVVKVIEPQVFSDARGEFYESFNARKFAALTGVQDAFVQDNHSLSRRGVVRGLHYQIQSVQGKLVRVIAGSVLDVVVDLRRSSDTFGKHVSITLSAQNKRMLWVPKGFAHGFLALEDNTEFLYKTTDYWAKEHERTLLWNDPALGIDWPLAQIGNAPILHEKDAEGKPLAEADCFT